MKYITFLTTLHSVYHFMYPLTLSVASLIGFTHEYPFQTASHPPRTLFLHSASANCHVLYKGLCAVAPLLYSRMRPWPLGFETRQESLRRNEAEVKLNSGTGQSQSNSWCLRDTCNKEAVVIIINNNKQTAGVVPSSFCD